MFDLTGKGALVTGATGGIGGAIAKVLHAQGANVAVSGTKAERLQAAAIPASESGATAGAMGSGSGTSGVSGGSGEQDHAVAEAGAAAF